MRSYQTIEDESRRRNLRFLMGLRAAAFCGQLATIFYCYYGLGIVLPVAQMVGVAALLVAFNLYSFARLRSAGAISEQDLMLGLMADVAVLGVQLHYSGGTSNPFVSFFMLPVILGAVTMAVTRAWMIYGLTIVAYLALAIEDHYRPMPAMASMPEMSPPGLVDRSALHMHGMMLGYAICAAALVYMIGRIRANLRARDEEVATLRAQALEQGHLLRLGLLTAGAAHELGTPLTTVSVIIKDWQDLGVPEGVDERASDLEILHNQVQRCKAVISDILDASGQTRGEGATAMPLHAFLTEICDTWRSRNPSTSLEVRVEVGDRLIAADQVLAQSVVNLLDNAMEASLSEGGDVVTLRAGVLRDVLSIEVSDAGPGFRHDILEVIGKPFVTSKAEASDRPRGLGLFLVKNTAKALAGELVIGQNTCGIGACVKLEIPLASIGVGREN